TPPSSEVVAARTRESAGGGDMRDRVRAFDWSATPLGPIEHWSQSTKTLVDTVLGSGFAQILLWGPELIQIYNDAYGDVIGRKHPTALGMPTRECWPETWHINEPIYARVMGGETVHLENAPYPLDRHGALEEAYFTLSYSPVRDDDERIAGVLVTLVETTKVVRAQLVEAERARLVRELEVESARLEEVFRQAPAFMAMVRGEDYVFDLANDAYIRLVGGRDIIGKPVREALPEVAQQGFIELLDQVLRSGQPFVGHEIPVTLEQEDGEKRELFLEFVYQPITDADGNRVGVVAHGYDVTEQTRARREVERVNAELERSAAELRASEQRLRDIFEQAPVAVAVLSGPEHVYTTVSPRYAQMPGGGRPIHGRPVREAFPELVGQGLIELLDRVYETAEPYFAPERLVRLDLDRDGIAEDYYFNIGYQPLLDPDGKVYAVASVAYDVTDQMRERHELEVAREIAEDARHEAELANRAKSAFLTTMSHELRTPLNAVAGYADLLLLGVRGPLADGQREDLERIKRSGQYLLGLINDVLNFAKLDAGQVEYRIETVQVAPLLEGLEELIRPQVDTKGLRYHHGTCNGELALRADPEKVRQILLNLLANAVKFTDAGGEVTLECHSTGDFVAIEVCDTGRGIPAGQLETIFDPFVQVDRHLTPMSQQGVGLGLAISRDLAIGMGGGLEASSTVGRGSRFTLTLPRAREP
ncbi:MAG TPA: PAS domain-containing protein, partial [Gemmatimonadaceae bacterium]